LALFKGAWQRIKVLFIYLELARVCPGSLANLAGEFVGI